MILPFRGAWWSRIRVFVLPEPSDSWDPVQKPSARFFPQPGMRFDEDLFRHDPGKNLEREAYNPFAPLSWGGIVESIS